tara:strand:+ start:400 stop:903 length:504 start_codon:yes stop_codon:yes gene_type:complete
MKITKQRLKEIIREELLTEQAAPGLGNDVRFTTVEGSREDMMMPAISMADMEAAMAADDAGLGDLQSDEKFTGGSPEERLLTLIKARELLAAMGKEELTALSKSLDAEQVAVLRHILANPMYAPMEENITPGVQQLMKHHPHAAAKIKELAGNGYRASEIKRMLQLR